MIKRARKNETKQRKEVRDKKNERNREGGEKG